MLIIYFNIVAAHVPLQVLITLISIIKFIIIFTVDETGNNLALSLSIYSEVHATFSERPTTVLR